MIAKTLIAAIAFAFTASGCGGGGFTEESSGESAPVMTAPPVLVVVPPASGAEVKNQTE